MEIKVLGPGCVNCTKLYEITEGVVKELGLDTKVQKVTDILQISMAGIMSTPGLVVDGKLKHSGKPVPSADKVRELITEEM